MSYTNFRLASSFWYSSMRRVVASTPTATPTCLVKCHLRRADGLPHAPLERIRVQAEQTGERFHGEPIPQHPVQPETDQGYREVEVDVPSVTLSLTGPLGPVTFPVAERLGAIPM